jgi:DNA-binding PadR family transcriptional regulator
MKKPVPDEVILGLLKKKPSHGYELLAYFRSKHQLGRNWTMSTSQLYAVLKRLDGAGAIVGKKLESTNAPPRIEYAITHHGEKQLLDWLFVGEPSPNITRIRVMFLSRIFIANLLGMDFEKIVDAQVRTCKKQKEKYISLYHESKSDIERLTIDFIINQLTSSIQWLEESNFSINIP